MENLFKYLNALMGNKNHSKVQAFLKKEIKEKLSTSDFEILNRSQDAAIRKQIKKIHKKINFDELYKTYAPENKEPALSKERVSLSIISITGIVAICGITFIYKKYKKKYKNLKNKDSKKRGKK